MRIGDIEAAKEEFYLALDDPDWLTQRLADLYVANLDALPDLSLAMICSHFSPASTSSLRMVPCYTPATRSMVETLLPSSRSERTISPISIVSDPESEADFWMRCNPVTQTDFEIQQQERIDWTRCNGPGDAHNDTPGLRMAGRRS